LRHGFWGDGRPVSTSPAVISALFLASTCIRDNMRRRCRRAGADGLDFVTEERGKVIRRESCVSPFFPKHHLMSAIVSSYRRHLKRFLTSSAVTSPCTAQSGFICSDQTRLSSSESVRLRRLSAALVCRCATRQSASNHGVAC